MIELTSPKKIEYPFVFKFNPGDVGFDTDINQINLDIKNMKGESKIWILLR